MFVILPIICTILTLFSFYTSYNEDRDVKDYSFPILISMSTVLVWALYIIK